MSVNLTKSKTIATGLLIVMVGVWVTLLIISQHIDVAYKPYIYILVLGAEAGMVGGLADWYAVTVLFRDPFKHIWVPRLIRDHTAIIARNQTRIAHSMGRFVQENFLAPDIIERELRKIDVTERLALWLANTKNTHLLTKEIAKLVPYALHILDNPKITVFLKQTSLEWIQDTRINRPTSKMMHAMFDHGLHRDVIAVGLSTINHWIKNNPYQTERILSGVIDQSGMMSVFSKAALFLGFDVQAKAISAIVKTLNEIEGNPHHPIREMIEQSINQWTLALSDDDSEESKQLDLLKKNFINSATLVDFIAQVMNEIRLTLINDLELGDESAIRGSVSQLLVRIGEQLQQHRETRNAINDEIISLCKSLADRYALVIVSYIRTQIINWDTRHMIEKIETEVGSDLQMIRINGVIVGSSIGLVLGILRFFIEH